jgi:hypothetical protein
MVKSTKDPFIRWIATMHCTRRKINNTLKPIRRVFTPFAGFFAVAASLLFFGTFILKEVFRERQKDLRDALESAENMFAVRNDLLDFRVDSLNQKLNEAGLLAADSATFNDSELLRETRRRLWMRKEDINIAKSRLKMLRALFDSEKDYPDRKVDGYLLESMDQSLKQFEKEWQQQLETFTAKRLELSETTRSGRPDFENLFWILRDDLSQNMYREGEFIDAVARHVLTAANKKSHHADKQYQWLSNWSWATYSLSFIFAVLAAFGGAHDALPKP